MLACLDPDRPELPEDVQEQVNIEIKYEGYIKRQMQQVAQFKKLEGRKLPEAFEYGQVKSLRREAVQKLNQVQPATVGQASRISRGFTGGYLSASGPFGADEGKGIR